MDRGTRLRRSAERDAHGALRHLHLWAQLLARARRPPKGPCSASTRTSTSPERHQRPFRGTVEGERTPFDSTHRGVRASQTVRMATCPSSNRMRATSNTGRLERTCDGSPRVGHLGRRPSVALGRTRTQWWRCRVLRPRFLPRNGRMTQANQSLENSVRFSSLIRAHDFGKRPSVAVRNKPQAKAGQDSPGRTGESGLAR